MGAMKQKETKSEKSLMVNSIFSSAYKLLNVLFPLISATYLARILAPEGIGKIAYAQNIVSYFLLLATLGIPYYGIREIAKCRGNLQEKSKIFSELLIINLLSTVCAVVAYCAVILLLFPSNIQLYLVCGLELLFNVINIDWLYEGDEEYVYITIRSSILKLLALAALFVLVRGPEDYILYALIHALGICGNYLLNIANAHKKVRLRLQGLNIKRHINSILVLMLSTVMGSLYNKIDITMLGWMSGDAAVGWYTNAHKVIGLVLTLVVSVSAVFLPRLSYVYSTDRKKFAEYTTIGLKAVLILAIPGCMGILITAPNMMSTLFGGEFLPGATTLRILAVFTVIRGAGDLLCYQAIISSGNESKLVLARMVASVANIVLNAAFIPRYGHNGAAMASVISELIVNGMLLPLALRITKPTISWKFLISVLVGTGLMAVVAMAVQHLLGYGTLSMIVTVVAGIGAYCLGLLLTKNELLIQAKGFLVKPKNTEGQE